MTRSQHQARYELRTSLSGNQQIRHSLKAKKGAGMTTTNDLVRIYANTKRILEFTITDGDNNDAPLGLGGLTIEWALSKVTARGYEAQATVFKSTAGAGVTVTDAPGGKLEVTLDPADTQGLIGDYHQELEVFDGTGAGVVVAVGTVEIRRNVSGP